jgi:hypothetical protein
MAEEIVSYDDMMGHDSYDQPSERLAHHDFFLDMQKAGYVTFHKEQLCGIFLFETGRFIFSRS